MPDTKALPEVDPDLRQAVLGVTGHAPATPQDVVALLLDIPPAWQASIDAALHRDPDEYQRQAAVLRLNLKDLNVVCNIVRLVR